MEKLRLYQHLKKHVRGITAALTLTAASAVLMAPPETYAQNSSEKPLTPSSPTPVLGFETPESIQTNLPINRRLHNPIFTPMPEAPVPQWTGEARITFYCLPGKTFLGTPVRDGIIATDPNIIPLGSKVDIEDLGDGYIAEDTGDGVKGLHVDLWIEDCLKAKNLGSMLRRIRVRR